MVWERERERGRERERERKESCLYNGAYSVALLYHLVVISSGRRLNVALDVNGGTCTASSALTSCGRAIDGRDHPNNSAWFTDRGDGHSIQIDFAISGMVETVNILQHCRHYDKTKYITVEFSEDISRTVMLLTCRFHSTYMCGVIISIPSVCLLIVILHFLNPKFQEVTLTLCVHREHLHELKQFNWKTIIIAGVTLNSNCTEWPENTVDSSRVISAQCYNINYLPGTLCLQFEMDCSESTCDTVTYETFPVQVATSFMKITLDKKCVEGGIGGFREVRALSMQYDGKKNMDYRTIENVYLCTASHIAKNSYISLVNAWICVFGRVGHRVSDRGR